MALAARYILKRAKNTGKVAVTFEVRDIPESYTSGGETKTDLGGRWDQSQSLWYGRASDQTGPALTWDTTNNVPGADNPTSWENTLTRVDGTSDVSTVTVAYNDGVVTVTGLRDVPVSFDASAIKNKDTSVWSRTTGSSYANIICERNSVMELYGIYVAPRIESLTLTGPAAGTMVYRAGSYDTGSQTVTPSSVVLQISRDQNFGTLVESFNVNPELSAGAGEHSTVITGLETETLYYMRLAVSYTGVAVSAEDLLSNVAQLQTQRRLPAPTVTGVSALDGAGSVSWGSVENAAGYEIAVVDSANTDPVSGTSAASPWNFNEATSGTKVQGKYIRIHALAVANQYEWGTSEWSAGTLIPDNRTPEEEEPSTPVEINMTRRIYKAIPYIDVPVGQIGANGSSPKDVITVEYADEHYVQSGGEIPASQLPIATSLELGAIKVGSHLSIDADTGVLSVTDTGSIASGNTGLVTGGTVYTEINKYSAFKDKTLETSVRQNNANAVTGDAVYTFVTTVSNLPKAKAAGGSGNAGVVYVTNASDKEGLIIDGTNAGQIKVDFATYSSWSSTVANKVVNPSYVKQAIEGYVADATKVTATGGSGKGGMIVKLDANGFIDGSMLKVVSVTNYFEAASQAAMLALSDAQDGDICIRTDEHKTYILMSDKAENGYATLSNWKELTAPTGTVTSVNGKAGATVTLSISDIYATGNTKASIATSIGTPSSETYALATAKAVYDAIKTVTDTFGGAQTYAATASVTSGSGALVTSGAVFTAISDLQLGAASKKGVATSVTSNGTDLPTAAAVYTAINDNISALDYSDVGAAAETHDHGIGDITYFGSGTSRVGYSAGTTISSGSTAGQLATAKAVYDYKPFVNRIIAGTSGTTTFSGVTTNLATTITSENYSIPTAYAVQQALSGKAASSHNQAITTIYATGTTAFTGTVTAFGSYAATSEDYQVATAYAIKTALAGKAPSSHTHTSAQISDAISTVADPSASATFNKVVKTESTWGQIGASLIPIDDDSITLMSGQALQVSESWLTSRLDVRYLQKTTAKTTYVALANVDATEWTAGTSYTVGQMVRDSNGRIWRCIQANTANSNNGPSGVSNQDEQFNFIYWQPIWIEFSSRFDGTITGDGTTTEFTVTHSLGTKDVDVSLIDNSTDQEVFAAVTMYSATQVKIGFGAAPESGKVYRVVVRK